MRKTIKQTLRFLESMKSGVIKRSALLHIKNVLEKTLFMNVYVTSLYDVYSIDDMEELKDLIKGEASIRRGSYNYFYRIWKLQNAPFPHELTGVMKANTFVEVIGDEVQMYIPVNATMRKGFNFGPIHERRKSVLKSTVYFAWKNIMKTIRELYRRFIEIA